MTGLIDLAKLGVELDVPPRTVRKVANALGFRPSPHVRKIMLTRQQADQIRWALACKSENPEVQAEIERSRDVAERAAQERSKYEDAGVVVYFLAAGEDAVKIGTSRGLPKRLHSLASGSHLELRLLGTIPGDASVEKMLHGRFRHLHIRREWFRAAPELLAFIREAR